MNTLRNTLYSSMTDKQWLLAIQGCRRDVPSFNSLKEEDKAIFISLYVNYQRNLGVSLLTDMTYWAMYIHNEKRDTELIKDSKYRDDILALIEVFKKSETEEETIIPELIESEFSDRYPFLKQDDYSLIHQNANDLYESFNEDKERILTEIKNFSEEQSFLDNPNLT